MLIASIPKWPESKKRNSENEKEEAEAEEGSARLCIVTNEANNVHRKLKWPIGIFHHYHTTTTTITSMHLNGTKIIAKQNRNNNTNNGNSASPRQFKQQQWKYLTRQ